MPPPKSRRTDGRATFTITASRVTTKKPSTAAIKVEAGLGERRSLPAPCGGLGAMSVDIKTAVLLTTWVSCSGAHRGVVQAATAPSLGKQSGEPGGSPCWWGYWQGLPRRETRF